jgi:TolB-like protein/Tfp pilus assembly protein PilF/predicted Ser/Thr protein kinase
LHYLSEGGADGQSHQMNTATTVCGKCGAKIFGDATREVCPACLLESGLRLLDEESVAGVDLSAVAAYSAEAAAKAGSAKAEDLGRADGVPVPDRTTPQRLAGILGDFGDYELLEEIGRGGQGVVYRARQKSLNRTVALKVIGLGHWATEAHVKRFRREAEAAASLEHPGIVPIHDVGERDGSCYFSMKFIEGGQLDEVVRRTPMSIRQAAELIAKVARTVHYAHQHGILHRDIKPGNILLDREGEPHLTDFGLARLVETESTVTRTKEVLGTPSYMAPEQAVGETAKLTGATDVYGLGAVLYQLLTGHAPFAGGTTYETIRLLLDNEPRPPRLLNPKIDRDLSTICLKCLEKDPQRRYSSALALAEDLEHWLKHEPIRAHRTGIFTRGQKWVRRKPATAAAIALSLALATAVGWNVWKSEIISRPATNGIAVLPFENLSHDPDNAYFADGIQEEILTRLASIAGLKVISRTSTSRYQSKPRNLAEIAKQLGVANILEGGVQKTADQVRVNVLLVNAQTDSHLWAETYDRKLTDVFAVESEIAKKVADRLLAKLTGNEAATLNARPTENSAAHDLYLKGRFFWNKRTSADMKTALSYFEQAANADPNYAVAYAGMADCYLLLPLYGGGVPTEMYPKAIAMAQKAISLDPSLGEPHASLGLVHALFDFDFAASVREFEEAIRLNPNYATAHHWFGDSVLPALGQFDRANAEAKRALELDPLSVVNNTDAATVFWITGRYQEAVAQFRKALEMDPKNYTAHWQLGQALEGVGDLRGAIAAYEKATNLDDDPLPLGLLAAAKAKAGDRAAALTILSRLQEIAKNRYVPDYAFGLIYLALGQNDEAMRWLESSYAKHQPDLNWIRVDPGLRPLHGNPRFEALAEKIVPARDFNASK